MRLSLCIALGVALAPRAALAGGLDIPTTFTARHAAMAGAAVGIVDDASAVYHNPAGLGLVERGSALVNVSAFATNLQTNPERADQNLTTGTQIGPGFFLGAAYRVHPMVTLGLAAYPLGAASGKFEYDNDVGVPTINEQFLVAFEVSPALAVNLPGDLSLGLGYRVSVLKFDRTIGAQDNPGLINVRSRGADYTGLRAGLTWKATDSLQLGVTYRHRIQLAAHGDRGTLLNADLHDIRASVVVPAKIVVGGMIDLGRLKLYGDLQYIFNSQFKTIPLSGQMPDQTARLETEFQFYWKNSIIYSGGQSVDLTRDWTLRYGYAYDQTTTNPAYPVTFGSPPADAHYLTLGFTVKVRSWELDAALAHRFANSRVIQESEIADEADCRFCASAGRYKSQLDALFFDVRLPFGAGGSSSY